MKQASYVDTYCWDSLMHHESDSNGNFEERSLWVHKVSGEDRKALFGLVLYGEVLLLGVKVFNKYLLKLSFVK